MTYNVFSGTLNPTQSIMYRIFYLALDSGKKCTIRIRLNSGTKN